MVPIGWVDADSCTRRMPSEPIDPARPVGHKRQYPRAALPGEAHPRETPVHVLKNEIWHEIVGVAKQNPKIRNITIMIHASGSDNHHYRRMPQLHELQNHKPDFYGSKPGGCSEQQQVRLKWPAGL